jgi:DNA repair exonuclease SbcCD ATPase subunit
LARLGLYAGKLRAAREEFERQERDRPAPLNRIKAQVEETAAARYEGTSFAAERLKYQNEIAALETQLTEARRDREYYEFFVQMFGKDGVRKDLSAFSSEITGEFVLERETGATDYQVRYHNPTGGPGYDEASKGERKRYDLAAAFALQDAIFSELARFNFLIVDEAFDGLDEPGRQGVRDLLEAKRAAAGLDALWVVTHEPAGALSGIDRRWRVRKTEGASRLEVL